MDLDRSNARISYEVLYSLHVLRKTVSSTIREKYIIIYLLILTSSRERLMIH